MKSILSIIMLLISCVAYGQVDVPAKVNKGIIIDTNFLLIVIAVMLLIPLRILANTFIAAAKRYYMDNINSGSLKVLIPLCFILINTSLLAQTTASPTTASVQSTAAMQTTAAVQTTAVVPAATQSQSWGLLTNTMTIMLLCVIGLELLLIVIFALRTKDLIQKKAAGQESPEARHDIFTWMKEKWTAMNFKPIEEEYKIDTGHSYDNIRELDNIIPPWFTTAFIITIIFGIGYFYRYQIAKSGPSQIQEYNSAIALAEIQHDEYLKTAANAIDESNVKIMTGADLEEGKKTFQTICAACHRVDGGGQVGPNLTDDYWIHGGALKDLFKTIKYGYPEKGMISWKDQLSPSQMAQAANYILTLRGTNPPNPKEQQGTLYVPDTTTADTTSALKMKVDTLIKK
ncbi:MAG: cbb3-type cytochrome c oxidase N-terminal domain-containing protein [Saprospiraceae bacterium]